MDRSTTTRAIGEVRTLLAQRGCTIAPGIRRCALAEVARTGLERASRPAHICPNHHLGWAILARPHAGSETTGTSRSSSTGCTPDPASVTSVSRAAPESRS
uniref:hypothetical protein n=1 Tax=Streptomyces chartreusis TaxID=1969 RepID=UPI003F4906C8